MNLSIEGCTPKIDLKRDKIRKVLGKVKKNKPKTAKKQVITKKYTLKMEPLGNYLTFRNRP